MGSTSRRTSRGVSSPPASTRSGSPTSLMCGPPRISSIWRWSSTPFRAGSSVGRSPAISKRAWRSRRSTWRSPPATLRLIHHSDRGVQYASLAYLARLNERKVAVSMSRVGNPYDNAKAESFMKTLKQEEVYANAYLSLEHARRQIGVFIEDVYNAKRLHSALSYKPPVEFEAEFRRDTQHPTNQNEALSPI